jgi:hypothetical protein
MIWKFLCLDKFSWDPLRLDRSVEGDKKPIDPISDIGIDRINNLIFLSATFNVSNFGCDWGLVRIRSELI